MTDEAETIFKTGEEIEEFINALLEGFRAVLRISAIGGITLGALKASLFAELLARMHHYKMEGARELALAHRPELQAMFEKEVEELWPLIREELDKDLGAAAEIIRRARGEEVH